MIIEKVKGMFITALAVIVFLASAFVGQLVLDIGSKYVGIVIFLIWVYLMFKLYESIETHSKGASEDNAKKLEMAVNLFYLTIISFLGFFFGILDFAFKEIHSSYHEQIKTLSEGGETGKGIPIIGILFAIIDFFINIVEFLYHKHDLLFYVALWVPGSVVALWLLIDNDFMEGKDETRLNKLEIILIERKIELVIFSVPVLILLVIFLLYMIRMMSFTFGEFFTFLALVILIFLANKIFSKN